MEEVSGGERIQRQMLEDARHKAQQIRSKGRNDLAQRAAESEARLAAAVEKIKATNAERTERERSEIRARLPLEKMRLRTRILDQKLKEGMREYFGGLDEARRTALVAVLVRRAAPLLRGRAVRLRSRGLGREGAAEVLRSAVPDLASVTDLDSPELPAPGMVAETLDGLLVLRATLDLVEETLLAERRLELISALVGDEVLL
ncbi:MAG TPA: hypothetical protein VMC79_06945 [Rectinemataceae bacterium]|nr:hypothetical protein [Rectinemataceae bacterium]